MSDHVPTHSEQDLIRDSVNTLSKWIGEWAESKGFREDWDDAAFLRALADSHIISGQQRWEITGQPERDEVARESVGAILLRIAAAHERMAHSTKLLLMVSEIAEALEGQRDGGNYDEELADLIIRALENAHKRGADIGGIIVDKQNVNEGRPHKHGRKF